VLAGRAKRERTEKKLPRLTSLRAERAEGRKDVAAWSAMADRGEGKCEIITDWGFFGGEKMGKRGAAAGMFLIRGRRRWR